MIGIMTAAGKGTRMKALTGIDIPKVLLEINKKPIISFGIESMLEIGVNKIYIIVLKKYLSLFEEKLKKYKNIEFISIEKSDHIMDSLDTLAKFVTNDSEYDHTNAIYWLADNLFVGNSHIDNIKKLNEMISNETPETGFILVETKHPKDFITMNKDGTFSEKPANPETNLSASGVFVVNEKALLDTSKRILNQNTGEYTIWDSWMSEHLIKSVKTTDTWIDVGTPERYYDVKSTLEREQ